MTLIRHWEAFHQRRLKPGCVVSGSLLIPTILVTGSTIIYTVFCTFIPALHEQIHEGPGVPSNNSFDERLSNLDVVAKCFI
jgi:hypothetical protein